MKTLILSFILIFGLAASNHGKPINDIYSVKEPIFTEEAYISDIPFNTWEVAVNAILEGDEAKLAEEPNVNDIPFDTRSIACKYLLKKFYESSVEANVNDIPFNTQKVLCEHLAALLVEKYRNEQSISDLPSGINKVILHYGNGSQSNYTIIYPAKPVIHEVKSFNNSLNNELRIIPKASL
jgi:hypothetical protein